MTFCDLVEVVYPWEHLEANQTGPPPQTLSQKRVNRRGALGHLRHTDFQHVLYTLTHYCGVLASDSSVCLKRHGAFVKCAGQSFWMDCDWSLRADVLLGEGSFGRVYQATSVGPRGQTRVVALKKSRASLVLRNTVLNHERRILQRLQGHPAFARVYAYGRLEHFEYLATELLGPGLDTVNDRGFILPMANTLMVAEQMLSALEFMHRNGLVHCDVKPGNILLHPNDPARLFLVDFGLTRAVRNEANSDLVTSSTRSLVGSLAYASLNMHHRICPAPRDDVESLGYSLLKLASGALPWQYNVDHGTKKVRLDQVRIKKESLRGRDLARRSLQFVGDIIEHARGLHTDQLPDYGVLRSNILKARRQTGPATVHWCLSSDDVKSLQTYTSPSVPEPRDPGFNLCAGQIICCQIDVRVTLEGYSARAGDPLFWRDPKYSPDKWTTQPRPAVVLGVAIDKFAKLREVRVACIGRGADLPPGAVPISPSPSEGKVTPTPKWPFSDSYCYVFPRPLRFLCYPGEVRPVRSHWTLSSNDIDLLHKTYTNSSMIRSLPTDEKYFHQEIIFAKVTELDPRLSCNSAGQRIHWEGNQAWYDDYKGLIQRRREHGFGATGADASGNAPVDSYEGSDYERWPYPPGELSFSVTAGVDDVCIGVPDLPRITTVEISDDVLYQ